MADAHHFRSFINREAAEEAQFDDPFLLWIELLQLFESFVDREKINLRCVGDRSRTGDRESLLLRAAPFCCLMFARMIDQNAPHQLRRDPVKLRAILPMR